ncbi:hypothetical protein BSG1_13486 [Bacillus sp. SG-1]|nr:hypothetical protein BSG1_13486 [Bacillus sp. SG-1]
MIQKESCENLVVEAPPMSHTIQRIKQGYSQQMAGKEDKRKKFISLIRKPSA